MRKQLHCNCVRGGFLIFFVGLGDANSAAHPNVASTLKITIFKRPKIRPPKMTIFLGGG